MAVEGTVYLIHFERPIGSDSVHGKAQHYIGWALDLDSRIADHRSGRGSAIMKALKDRGVSFEVARTWPGTRDFERKLKRRKKARALCPICRRETKK